MVDTVHNVHICFQIHIQKSFLFGDILKNYLNIKAANVSREKEALHYIYVAGFHNSALKGQRHEMIVTQY
jgi:hypothetical protein